MSTMCDIETLRLFVNERLTAVAEDILAVFVRTIVDYQQQLDLQWRHSSSQQQQGHSLNSSVPRRDHGSQLGAINKTLHTTQTLAQNAAPWFRAGEDSWRDEADHHNMPPVQDFLPPPVRKEEVSLEQQKRAPSQTQEEPEPLHIKEEQEDLVQAPEEADGSTLTLLPVKSEVLDKDGETTPQASTSTEHGKALVDVEECGTPQTASDVQVLSSHCSDTEDSDEWEETREEHSALNAMQSHEADNTSLIYNMSQEDLISTDKTQSSRNCSANKPFSCTICPRGFYHIDDLRKHMMIHTGKKPFTCVVCGKGFTRNASVKMHMRIHTGEKPFSCTVCRKDFYHMGDMKKHMRTHTGERPFYCTICGKGWTTKGYLTQHMRSHTGEKPFKCAVCGKTFSVSGNLNVHMRTHAKE